jgi:hypothetical protein
MRAMMARQLGAAIRNVPVGDRRRAERVMKRASIDAVLVIYFVSVLSYFRERN